MWEAVNSYLDFKHTKAVTLGMRYHILGYAKASSRVCDILQNNFLQIGIGIGFLLLFFINYYYYSYYRNNVFHWPRDIKFDNSESMYYYDEQILRTNINIVIILCWWPVGELLSWELFSCNPPRDLVQSVSKAEVPHRSIYRFRYHVGRRFLREGGQQGSTKFTYVKRKNSLI